MKIPEITEQEKYIIRKIHERNGTRPRWVRIEQGDYK